MYSGHHLLSIILSISGLIPGLKSIAAEKQFRDNLLAANSPAFTSSAIKKEKRPLQNPGQQLKNWFQCFSPLVSTASYFVTVCGDLPDNDHPEKINSGNEPGHVFIILSKRDSVNSYSIAFGFYPMKPVSSLFFKKVRSRILLSRSREYEVSVCKAVTMEQFQFVMEKAAELSGKKYDLNKYNCYDYALEVFNSIPGIEKLPVSKARFPFLFGRGGSPCCLYRDLKNVQQQSDFWRGSIEFGQFHSPPNCGDK